jgi:hypothetical protein
MREAARANRLRATAQRSALEVNIDMLRILRNRKAVINSHVGSLPLQQPKRGKLQQKRSFWIRKGNGEEREKKKRSKKKKR